MSLAMLSKLNNSIIKFLGEPIIKYGFLLLIILQIMFVKKIKTSYLEIFNDNKFKVIYAFLIAYYACFDPIYSIALTTLIIISIQELHSRYASESIYSLLPEKSIMNNSVLTSGTVSGSSSPSGSASGSGSSSASVSGSASGSPSGSTINIKDGKMKAKIFDNDELVFELINKHSLQKQPSIDDKLTGEYDFNQEPAFTTITNNIDIDIKDQVEMLNILGLPNGYEKL